MADLILPAAEFKAKCLALIDRVRERGEPITITKRGRVVARLIPAGDEEERPWLALRGQGRWVGDPYAPVVEERDIEVLKRATRARRRRPSLCSTPTPGWNGCSGPPIWPRPNAQRSMPFHLTGVRTCRR